MEDNEKIFRLLEHYEPTPPPDVWEQLERALDASSPAQRSKVRKRWLRVTAGVIIIIVAVVYWYFSHENSTTTLPPDTTLAEPMPTFSTMPIVVDSIVEQVDNEQNIIPSLPQNMPIEVANLPITTPPITEIKPSDTTTFEPILEEISQITKSPENQLINYKDSTIISIASTPVIETLPEVLPDTSSLVLPAVFVDLNQNKLICRGEQALLRVPGGENVVWSNGQTTTEIAVSPTETTAYHVSWEQDGHCYYGSITVSILSCNIFFPNAFSPNGDGINDVFRPVGSGVTNYLMLIFSINGERLFESHDITIGWDGRSGNRTMPPGAYIYRISFQDITGQQRNVQGTVSLVL